MVHTMATARSTAQERDQLGELVGWLEDMHGAVSADEMADAEAELDQLYAEHMRRRAGR